MLASDSLAPLEVDSDAAPADLTPLPRAASTAGPDAGSPPRIR